MIYKYKFYIIIKIYNNIYFVIYFAFHIYGIENAVIKNK